MGLEDFFSREAGQQRRNWLDSKMQGVADTARYYAGPYAPGYAVNTLAEMNPVQDAGNAMADGRDGNWLGMLANTAAVVAPAVAGKVAKAYNPRMADDAAQWIEDALMGVSMNPTRAGAKAAAGDFVADEAGNVPFARTPPQLPPLNSSPKKS